ncbi:MAG: HAD family hydrolase [Deltaproteobacteria bacterium]|nr:HAD family hydrolase [Deltaproteobacteria bacterium]
MKFTQNNIPEDNMLKAIVFDYNGVLVDDLRVHEEAYLFAAKLHNRPLSKETVQRYVSYAIDKKRKFYFGDISDQAWENILRTKTERYFEIASQKSLVFPDVKTILGSLSKKYTLALMSNTTRENFTGVFPAAIASIFKETLFADEVDNPKPSPEPLQTIMGRLGVNKDACCYVGDSLLDVEMSKSAGVTVFGVATGHNSLDELRHAGADYAVNRLSEVERILMG